jgi:hypothetical protein
MLKDYDAFTRIKQSKGGRKKILPELHNAKYAGTIMIQKAEHNNPNSTLQYPRRHESSTTLL